MARLVNNKVINNKNDSTYSTFDNNEHSITSEAFNDNRIIINNTNNQNQDDPNNINNNNNVNGIFNNCCKFNWRKCYYCYCFRQCYGSNDTISDDTDIEFALIKYSQVNFFFLNKINSIFFKQYQIKLNFKCRKTEINPIWNWIN